MSLLIKALDKAQNAKTDEARAQRAKTEAQAQTAKMEAQALSLEQAAKTEQTQLDKLKSERFSAKHNK